MSLFIVSNTVLLKPSNVVFVSGLAKKYKDTHPDYVDKMDNRYGIIMNPPFQQNNKSCVEYKVKSILYPRYVLGMNKKYLKLIPKIKLRVLPQPLKNMCREQFYNWQSLLWQITSNKRYYVLDTFNHPKSFKNVAKINQDQIISFDKCELLSPDWVGKENLLHEVNNRFDFDSDGVDISRFLTSCDERNMKVMCRKLKQKYSTDPAIRSVVANFGDKHNELWRFIIDSCFYMHGSAKNRDDWLIVYEENIDTMQQFMQEFQDIYKLRNRDRMYDHQLFLDFWTAMVDIIKEQKRVLIQKYCPNDPYLYETLITLDIVNSYDYVQNNNGTELHVLIPSSYAKVDVIKSKVFELLKKRDNQFPVRDIVHHVTHSKLMVNKTLPLIEGLLIFIACMVFLWHVTINL